MEIAAHTPESAAWWEAGFLRHADAGGAAVRRLLDHLPPDVACYLAERSLAVLHWGCGGGAGVAELGRRFPNGDIRGADFADAAVEAARRRVPDGAFFQADAGPLPRDYDVVFATALPHFGRPLDRLADLLKSCADLCVVAVPLGEQPLDPFHQSQFREESLPQRIGTFTATYREVLPADEAGGPLLVAVYASPAYRGRHKGGSVTATEMAKWDDFYAGLEGLEETPALEAFHVEFTAALAELLPAAATVLEAGCGAAFQSLALARQGRYQVSIMDFSAEALASARRRFDEARLTVDARLGDVFAAGEPRFDLVFNAGVLEHYTLAQQADFLRGMASRSRRYVLTLTPNRHCYWYWVWRIRGGKTGDWPFGKECPQGDLAAAFQRAGLRYLGQTHLGAAWTEDLLGFVRGLDDDARRDLLAVHRSGVLDPAHVCYLTASLGAVDAAAAPPRWLAPAVPEDFRLAELTSGLADSLALRLNAEARFRDYESRVYQQQERCQTLETQLTQTRATLTQESAQARVNAAEAQRRLREIQTSKTYRLAQSLIRARQLVAPSGSWRAHTIRTVVGGARGLLRPLVYLGRTKSAASSDGLAEVRGRTADGKRPILFLPSIPWNATLFQRPQHLARQFARLGHPVVYDCSGTDEALDGLREIEPNLFLYKGDAGPLHDLPDPLVWAFSYNFHLKDGFGRGADVVYDWIDDLTVFPYDQAFLRRNHARGLREAVLVASVARRLHKQAVAARPDALYLPNAAEYERFADETVAATDDPELSCFLQRPRPVAGYYGALASWFDYALLEETARRRRDWNFVLIGPDYDGSIAKQPLLRAPNVAWLGPRAYETLPGYLRRIDVALIPFVINDITLATSPLKLYEYFSAGKPVVTTPMPECEAHAEVRIVRTAEEFGVALNAALADTRSEEVVRRLRAVGRDNSWEARVRTVLERLTAPARRLAA